MRASSLKAKQDKKKTSPDNNYGLGIAKVTNINYEEYLVTLRVVSGASGTYERVPVPLTLPGAGARHFFGAIPQIGDLCVVGWMVQQSATTDSGEGTKTPVILSWLLPGVWLGRNWITASELPADEYEFNAGESKYWEGSFDTIRHKLRHIQPGNVLASSAQGADLVLDESVTLANRRGNEFRLRDQDQAAILRALQSFQALAGIRQYTGMVQRDATFLPTTMVSDGQLWDGKQQAAIGKPLSDLVLPTDDDAPEGFLTPFLSIRKSTDEDSLTRSLYGEHPYLDPYKFLMYGGFINEFGYVVDDKHTTDAVYGGKPLFRVSSQAPGNSVTDKDAQTLTEHRVELTHTADGTLPVTEQTDMYDADRVPDDDPRASGNRNPNIPFIEWVLGSVVGNNPFTTAGRKTYGLPLVATIFDGDVPNPRLEAATLAPIGSGVTPTPIAEQAATLFRLSPPMGDLPDTFWSVNKQGQLKAVLGSDPKSDAIEAYLRGGLKLGIGGKFQLLLDGHTELGTTGTSSLGLTAEKGSVKIYGGGPLKTHESDIESVLGTGRGQGDVPSVDIEARTNLRMHATKKVTVHGADVEVNGTSISLIGHDNITLDGVKKATISTENHQLAVNGKAQESYGGPKNALPTNFPLHERTYAPTFPGFVCERVRYIAGDREETFNLGNHTTSIKIGNMTYETLAGVWKSRAATSSITMGVTGINAKALAGIVSLTASAGTATMKGVASASLIATGGVATIRGSAGVMLGGPISGPDSGPVICAGSLEPFTGLPFATWGMGAKNHLVGV